MIALVNSMVDKHPLSTGTLLGMVVGGLVILFGVSFLILKIKK